MIELKDNNFVLTLEFIGVSEGKSVHRYILSDTKFQDNPLFSESDFQLSPLEEPESPEAIEALLDFLTLGEDDVEEEYFKDYSENQLRWRESDRRIRLIELKDTITAIAPIFWEIETLSCGSDIDWQEWKESDDNEGYLPVRLRLFSHELSLHIGSPDWDDDHRGTIASAYVTKDMSNQEILDCCLNMYWVVDTYGRQCWSSLQP